MSYDVNINDLPLQEDVDIAEQIDVEADFFQTAPPVSDGLHLVRLSISERKPNVQAQADDQGKVKFYMLFIQGEVIEPGTPNDRRYVRDMVSTAVMNNGSCKAVAVLKACGVPTEEIPRSHAGIIRKLYDVLQGQPSCIVRTQWQAQVREKGPDGKRPKPFLKGQVRFPQLPDGRFNHVVQDPDTGEDVYADAQITKYQKEESNV